MERIPGLLDQRHGAISTIQKAHGNQHLHVSQACGTDDDRQITGAACNDSLLAVLGGGQCRRVMQVQSHRHATEGSPSISS